MKIFLAAVLVSGGLASAASAITVDFNTFSEGDVLGLGTDFGSGVIADVTAIGGTSEAVVFDTTPGSISTGNDGDLTGPFTNVENATDVREFGNALIVQENATGGPDDFVGGSLIFDFASLFAFSTLSLLDAQDSTVATLFSGTDEVLSFTVDDLNASDTGNDPTDNQFTLLNFGGAVGDSLVVDFSASGAIGEFQLAAVPLPASLSLLLAGAGALVLVRRRKKS